jgi:iron complex transport system substrate-binding protein
MSIKNISKVYKDTAVRLSLFLMLAILPLNPVQAEIQVTDGKGRTVVLERPATIVVSLAPHITEVVFAAGAGEYLVGTVSYSDYPEAARALPRVGSYNSISLESLLALRPELVLA